MACRREKNSVVKARPRSVEALELSLLAGQFDGLISAWIQERSEGPSEFGADHLDAEHHVNSPDRTELEASRIEQEIAGGTADDRV